jgi:FkbM family methyltransferase
MQDRNELEDADGTPPYYQPRPSLKHRAFIGFLRLFGKIIRYISDDLYFTISVSILSELNCVMEFSTKAGPILLRSPSETTRIRAKRAHITEVDTLKWIENFGSDDVLWDIGSNIGIFTLYAAKVASVPVVALEILPWNYTGLMDNLTLNKLHDKVSVFCVGVNARTAPVQVSIPLTADTPGGHGGAINSDIDGFGRPVKPLYSMTSLGMAVDDLAALDGIPFPNHIKMDIDGNEENMLIGAKKTLTDKRIKSLMFEFQPGNCEHIIKEVMAL